jgi:transposase-like protein/IS1 family transposase
MLCPTCKKRAVRFGRDRKENQRHRCNNCKKTFIEVHQNSLGNMILAKEKSLMCLQLLVEGNSVRSTERITGVHRDTVLNLLEQVGNNCERFMCDRIRNIPVKDVQCDEIWGFVGLREKTKKENGIEDKLLGDAYTFVAIERYTKLILAWHLGRRTYEDTVKFTEKIDHATSGHFQISTDGFKAYQDAVVYSLGTRVDFAQLVKIYSAPREGEQRYSPAEVVAAVKVPVFGNPDPNRICTSHVERQNLTMRMQMRRLTRLTNAFSKKWIMLKASLVLNFAHYNFCRIHSTLKVTPAMEAGITNHVWTVEELICA